MFIVLVLAYIHAVYHGFNHCSLMILPSVSEKEQTDSNN